jgi:hypothetical protein
VTVDDIATAILNSVITDLQGKTIMKKGPSTAALYAAEALVRILKLLWESDPPAGKATRLDIGRTVVTVSHDEAPAKYGCPACQSVKDGGMIWGKWINNTFYCGACGRMVN